MFPIININSINTIDQTRNKIFLSLFIVISFFFSFQVFLLEVLLFLDSQKYKYKKYKDLH